MTTQAAPSASAEQPTGARLRARARAAPWLMIGALVLLAVFLLPARGAALRGDDEWTFEMRGLGELTHRTFLDQVVSGLSLAGKLLRPQVLGGLVSDPVIYYFNGHPALYRLYLVGLTVICGGLLWLLVRRVGGSTTLAALVILVFAGAVQFRFYHDAMLGYYGATQFALGLVLASLLALLRSLRGGGWRWAFLAALVFACACAMQEWVYPLAATHVCLAFAERRDREAFRAAVPVALVAIAFLLVGYLGRNGLASERVAAGYGIAFNVGHVLRSYLTQLLPPLPGSTRVFSAGPIAYFYGTANPYPLGSDPTPAELLAAAWRGAAVFAAVLAFGLWASARRNSRMPSAGVQGRLLAVGIPMWITPPLLLAVSSKYQVELGPGRGYVDVLVQVVGFALVATGVFIGILRLAARRGRTTLLSSALIVATLLGFASAVDGFNNLRIVALEQPVRQTRDLLETAAQNGALDQVPSGSTLLFSAHDMNWPTGSWVFGTNTGEAVLLADSGRNFDVRYAADQTPMNCAAGAAFPPALCAPPEPSAAWVRVRAAQGGGVIIVSRLTRPTPRTIETERTTDLSVYTEQSGASSPPPPVLTGTLPDGRPWSSATVRWMRVKAGDSWAIYHATLSPTGAPVAYSLNYPRSAVDFVVPSTPDQEVRIFGTKHLLP